LLTPVKGAKRPSEQSEREGEAPLALPMEGATRAPVIVGKMNEKGMSFIEIMVAVAIIAVSATVAVPNYRQWAANSDLRDGFVNLKGALQIARVIAMGGGGGGNPVAVQLNNPANPVAVPVNNPVINYYVMFVDPNRNGQWDANEQILSAQGLPILPLVAGPLLPTTPGVQSFRTGVVFVAPPAVIAFLSSGRRSLPNVPANQIITLQNGFNLQRTVTVSAIGDIF